MNLIVRHTAGIRQIVLELITKIIKKTRMATILTQEKTIRNIRMKKEEINICSCANYIVLKNL